MVNVKILSIALLLAFMGAAHFVAVTVGLYEQPFVWVDKIFHLLGGVATALFWVWFLQQLQTSSGSSKLVLASSIIGFVLLAALAWEIFELVYTSAAPAWANKFKFYSPSLGEALADMVANFLGGVIVSVFVARKAKNSVAL